MSTPITGGRLAAAGSGISRASAQLAQSQVMPSPASSATSVSSSAPATEILIDRGASPSRMTPLSNTFLSSTNTRKITEAWSWPPCH